MASGTPLGGLLGGSWAALGAPGGPPWARFFFLEGVLGAPWGRPGAILDPLAPLPDPLGELLGVSWRPSGEQKGDGRAKVRIYVLPL